MENGNKDREVGEDCPRCHAPLDLGSDMVWACQECGYRVKSETTAEPVGGGDQHPGGGVETVPAQ